MKKILIALSILTLAACSQPEKVDVNYSVIDEYSKRDIKRSVEIMLPERVSESTLKSIAEEIYAQDNDYERVFISYRLQEDPQGMYWATTHYDPDLEVKILGKTIEEKAKLDSTDPGITGEIIGKWASKNGYETTIYLYKENGKHYIAQVFGPDSKNTDEVTLTETEKGTRVEEVEENTFGEYFIINEDGKLEFWSENGNYYTAPKY